MHRAGRPAMASVPPGHHISSLYECLDRYSVVLSAGLSFLYGGFSGPVAAHPRRVFVGAFSLVEHLM